MPADAISVDYTTPAEAAIAYAESQRPDIEDPQVTRIIGIHADQAIVDLRVQVQADDFCHWYGVTGRVAETSSHGKEGRRSHAPAEDPPTRPGQHTRPL